VVHVKGKTLYRLIVLGRKRLSDVRKHEKEWAFVYRVSYVPGEIEDQLRHEEYKTKTRGERVRPAARPAGEGVYALVRHEDHTHIAYVLALPEEPGPVQRALEIEREPSYIISVKNPEAPSPPEAGLLPDEAAKYSKELEEKFHGRRFLPVDSRTARLSRRAVTAHWRFGRREARTRPRSAPSARDNGMAEIFRDLRLARSEFKIDPLIKGKWE
jgi:hypothetical protein